MTFGKLAAGLSTAPCLPQRSPLGRAIPAQKSHRRRQKHGCDQKANGDVMGSNVHNGNSVLTVDISRQDRAIRALKQSTDAAGERMSCGVEAHQDHLWEGAGTDGGSDEPPAICRTD